MVDPVTRRSMIQEVVEREGFVRLADLSEELGVARVTVHRDLDTLARLGAVERVRGGARSVNGTGRVIRTDFNLRRAQMAEEKAAIARRAIQEVPDGATIFLDSSTTCLALAEEIEACGRQGLTIVTNSPAILFRFTATGCHLIALPGDVDQSLRAITGHWALEFLGGLTLETAFLSAGGMTLDAGLMTTQRSLAEMARVAAERSSRCVALIDSNKFDRTALIPMVALKNLDLIVTDDGVGQETVDRYAVSGVTVDVAGQEPTEATRGKESP